MFINVPSPPKTLSADEKARLLEVVAGQGSRRDLALLTLALGTGLRLKEIVGLNVGGVTARFGDVLWRVDLPKAITKGRRGGVAFLSERVRSALEGYLGTRRSSSRPWAGASGPDASRRSSSTGRRSRGSIDLT